MAYPLCAKLTAYSLRLNKETHCQDDVSPLSVSGRHTDSSFPASSASFSFFVFSSRLIPSLSGCHQKYTASYSYRGQAFPAYTDSKPDSNFSNQRPYTCVSHNLFFSWGGQILGYQLYGPLPVRKHKPMMAFPSPASVDLFILFCQTPPTVLLSLLALKVCLIQVIPIPFWYPFPAVPTGYNKTCMHFFFFQTSLRYN